MLASPQILFPTERMNCSPGSRHVCLCNHPSRLAASMSLLHWFFARRINCKTIFVFLMCVLDCGLFCLLLGWRFGIRFCVACGLDRTVTIFCSCFLFIVSSAVFNISSGFSAIINSRKSFTISESPTHQSLLCPNLTALPAISGTSVSVNFLVWIFHIVGLFPRSFFS